MKNKRTLFFPTGSGEDRSKRERHLISTSIKDKKNAQARRANAICCLWKISKCLLRQTALEIVLLLVNNVHGRSITESQDRRNFDSARYL